MTIDCCFPSYVLPKTSIDVSAVHSTQDSLRQTRITDFTSNVLPMLPTFFQLAIWFLPCMGGPWSLDCRGQGLGLLCLETVCRLHMMAAHCLYCSCHLSDFQLFVPYSGILHVNAMWFSHPIHWQPPARPHML